MATKRPAPHVHPSRQGQVPEEPRRKRQKPNNAGPKPFKKAHPVNELKSQIRSLKRLLEHNDRMPATVRVEKERALQTAQHELREAEKAKKRSDIIGKYHKIRFFDRQKAAKRLKRAQKQLKACDDDGEERLLLEKVVDDAQVDVNYAQYFPLDQPYVSLFPRKNEDDGESDGKEGKTDTERKGDDAMWQKVKQCMVDGTLDALRNGKLRAQEQESEGEAVPTTNSLKQGGKPWRDEDVPFRARAGSRSSKPHEGMHEDVDDESDGGFFE